MWLAFALFLAWFAVSDWRNALEVFAFMSLLFGAILWITLSQRVWYDDHQVCTRTGGSKRRECLRYADIKSVSASHSWKRAAARRPISELQIDANDGSQILISLRHLNVPQLQEMVDEIHRRTGLAVPVLREFVR
jgi:hypothetical protein